MQHLRSALMAAVIILAMTFRLESGAAVGSAEVPTSAQSASVGPSTRAADAPQSGPPSFPGARARLTAATDPAAPADPTATASESAAAMVADLDPSTTSHPAGSPVGGTTDPSTTATAPAEAGSGAPSSPSTLTPTPTSTTPPPPGRLPTTGATGASDASDATVTPSAAESHVLALLNAERSRAGVAPLQLSSGAMAVARGWCAFMATHTLDHNPNLVEDLAQAGINDWRTIAENVGQGETVEQVHTTFMSSPVHRGNLLDAQLSAVGVGVATDGADVFVTLDFVGW